MYFPGVSIVVIIKGKLHNSVLLSKWLLCSMLLQLWCQAPKQVPDEDTIICHSSYSRMPPKVLDLLVITAKLDNSDIRVFL